tara:strand:- start:174 stop:527 length:354 start_codon:yes stop_codon:yes gene_type:complete
MDSMTTTQLKPKPTRTKRKQTTPKPMTESTYSVKEKAVRQYKHTEPVIIDSHIKDVQVLSTAAYIQDFKNRLHLNNVEVKELIDSHVEVYEYVKPYAVSAFTKVSDYVKSLRSKADT